MTGKVWLVGAGPSPYALLTLKAAKVLEKAEVVVYDRLVGQEILAELPECAEKIDVGKISGRHTVPQQEINQILLKRALEGKNVVRLKGGDPFLFGRGGEELELLAEYGIPFEIVPGISSAVSVPAFNGIPVTHRDAASSLHIITGHKKENEPYEIDFEALIRVKGTLVFLMGVSALEDICKGLMRAGMDQDTAAALLMQGATSGQKKIIATVSTLKEKADEQGIKTPAIIIIGKVCSYSSSFSWYERLPLFGKKIIVTRPRERNSSVSARLRELGAEVLLLPAIKTEAIKENEEFYQTLTRLSEYQYIAFTSPAGVNIFFDTLMEKKMDIRSIGNAKIAVIGPGTKKEVEKRGLIADYMPESYAGKQLGSLLGSIAGDSERILIPRAEQGGRDLISEIGKRSKAAIHDLTIYKTKYEMPETVIDQRKEIESGKISMAVFTSASTVKGFAEATAGIKYDKLTAVCIGKQTRAAAEARFMSIVMAKEATIDSLINAVLDTAQKKDV